MKRIVVTAALFSLFVWGLAVYGLISIMEGVPC